MPRAAAPAKLRPANHVIDSCESIPGRVDIPFHVRVISERFALAMKSGIELVPEADGDEFPVLSIGINARDPAAGS